MSVKIILADDHPMLRQGLRLLLEAEADFSLVGETGDSLEILSLVGYPHPDVLVLDLLMPGLRGLNITRQVHQLSPTTKIVVLSMDSEVASAKKSLSGADAYVPMKSTAEELVRAIREVVAGRQYFSATLTDDEDNIEPDFEALRMHAPDMLDHYGTLTRREREILFLVGEGYTSAEIAARLVISPRTVDMHRRNIVHKLGLRGQSALVRYALQHDIVLLRSAR